eukprot:Gb_09476 [translate_table: standard]
MDGLLLRCASPFQNIVFNHQTFKSAHLLNKYNQMFILSNLISKISITVRLLLLFLVIFHIRVSTNKRCEEKNSIEPIFRNFLLDFVRKILP